MSGYLSSLASHAVMPGPRVRPITPPFARTPLAATAPEPLEIETEIPAVAADEPRSAPGPVGRIRRDEATSRADRALTAAHVIETLSSVAAITHETPPTDGATDSRPRPVQRPPSPAMTGAVVPQHPVDQSPWDRRDRSPVRQDRGRIRPAASSAAPPPIAATGSADRRQRIGADRHEAPADVHIHIGRIELTAVTAPAPARRPPPAAKPAMPLDEYLKQRDRRAR